MKTTDGANRAVAGSGAKAASRPPRATLGGSANTAPLPVVNTERRASLEGAIAAPAASAALIGFVVFKARGLIAIFVFLLAAGPLSIAQAQTPSVQTQPASAPDIVAAKAATLVAPPRLPAISDAVNTTAALDYVVQEPMFGDLPFRLQLHDEGIDLTAHYISETMSNTAGYKGTGTNYAQQVDFGIGFDLGKLGIWSDAVVQFAMSDRAGRSTAADFTGSYFDYQEIFGQGQNLRLSEISIEKTLPAQALAIKVGFYPLGSDFATLPYVCNFINAAFCGHPESLPVNSGGSDGPAGGLMLGSVTTQVVHLTDIPVTLVKAVSPRP